MLRSPSRGGDCQRALADAAASWAAHIMSYRSPITESLIRSRSGSLIAVLTFATLATGLLQICVPLELRQLRASPNETGVTLAMFGFGMFAFEWVWGVVADRIGYRAPLVASQLLFGVFIVLLSRVESVPLIAIGYLLASGMMVAVGPIARSYLGTALHARLRATGLALLASQWVIAEAVGAGAGGALIDRLPIHDVMLAGAVLPLISAILVAVVFRGYTLADHHSRIDFDDKAEQSRSGGRSTVIRVLAVTATLVLLIQIGLGGELALLPLLVTNQLHLSASATAPAILAVGLIAGLLLVPGGNAADRWGRTPAVIAALTVAARDASTAHPAEALVQDLEGRR